MAISNVFKYDGTPLLIGGENLRFRESDLVYSARRGTYNVQCACYDSLRGRFCIAGGKASPNGTARLFTFSDWSHPDVEIASATLNLGHANSITYIPDTDEYIVACGGGTASSETQYNNQLAVIDASDLTEKRRITLGQYDKCDGVTFCGDCVFLQIYDTSGSNNRMELRSLDLSTILLSKSLRYSDVSEYLGYADSSCIASQDVTYDPNTGIIYRVHSGRNTGYSQNGTVFLNEWNYGILAGYNKSDLSFNGVVTFSVTDKEEVESYIFGADRDYILCEGLYNTYRISEHKFPARIGRIEIPSNADLNTYVVPGEYFSNAYAITITISNIPTGVISGFTLQVYQLGNDFRMQVLFNSAGDIFRRTSNNNNTWNAWAKLTVTNA